MRRRLLMLAGAMALVLAACGGGDDTGGADPTQAPAGDGASVAAGLEVFNGTCKTCHGEGGAGVEGLGKPMVNNEFIKSQDDAGLLAFIKVGRGAADEANSTGVAMPAKGGNPSLTDGDLEAVIAYLRSLN